MKSHEQISSVTLHSNPLRIRGGGNFGRQNIYARYSEGASAATPSSVPSEVLPLVQNVALFTFISFAMAELLNYCGLFKDEDGIKASRQAEEFAEEHFDSPDDFQATADRLWDTTQNWWTRNRRSRGGLLQLSTWKKKWHFLLNLYNMKGPRGTLQCLSFKHQFAIGCTIGMVCQQFSLATVSVAFYVYVASEMLYNLREAGRDFANDDTNFYRTNENQHTSSYGQNFDKTGTNKISNILNICSDCLEQVRSAVRQSADRVVTMLEGTDEDFDNGVGTIIAGAVFGLLLKSLL
jgi:hypothetical protein